MKWVKNRKLLVVCAIAAGLWWLDRVEVIPANYPVVQPFLIDGLKMNLSLCTSSGTCHFSPFLHFRAVEHGPYDFYMSVRDFSKKFSRARVLGVTLSTPAGDWIEQLAMSEHSSDWKSLGPVPWTDQFNEALFVGYAREEGPTPRWSNIVVPNVKTIFADVSFELERDGDTMAFTERFELRRDEKKYYVSFIVQSMIGY